MEVAPVGPERVDQGPEQVRRDPRGGDPRLRHRQPPGERLHAAHEEDRVRDPAVRAPPIGELNESEDVQLLRRTSAVSVCQQSPFAGGYYTLVCDALSYVHVILFPM